MITSLKNKEGYIYALIEWEQIDEEKILIKYAWIHINYRNNGAILNLVKIMAQDERTHKTQYIGWERENRNFQWYPLYQILPKLRRTYNEQN